MAEIQVERKSSTSWIWWVIAAIIVALLIWWLVDTDDDEIVGDVPAVTPATTPEPVAQGTGVTISEVLGTPATWMGRTWAGEVRVTEVPTDRGFWIEDQGARMFVILNDQPAERPVHIQQGQTLRITEGVLRDRTFLPQLPGTLDQDTRNIAQDQPIFLVVDEENIQMAGRR